MTMTRAILTYRNTPDRGTGLSPAYMLLGRNLKDFSPTRPPINTADELLSTWKEVVNYRELDLAKRSAKAEKVWSEHTKDHAPLEAGDHVMVQNQSGNQPLC